jgi:tight adherence protein C
MAAPLMVALLAAAGIALLSYGAYRSVQSSQQNKRVMAKVGHEVASPGDADGLPGLKAYAARIARSLGDKFAPKDEEDLSRIRVMFLNAGLRGRNTVVVFFGAKVLLAGLFLVSFVLFKIMTGVGLSVPSTMAALSFSAMIGFYAPNFWLKGKIARRREKIALGFPDALDLLVVCTEAGMALDACLTLVGEEMRLSNEQLSDEFRILNLEIRTGKPKATALRNLGVRTGIEDVKSLMTLLIQTDKFGASIGRALRVHSDVMRTKRTQKVEEIAAKLPVKLLFPTVFCIFPALFLLILGPAIIEMMRTWGH